MFCSRHVHIRGSGVKNWPIFAHVINGRPISMSKDNAPGGKIQHCRFNIIHCSLCFLRYGESHSLFQFVKSREASLLFTVGKLVAVKLMAK